MSENVGTRLKSVLTWHKFTPTKHWVEDNIELTKGAVKGMYQRKYAQHLDKIYDDLDDPMVEVVTLKSASQVKKTTLMLNWVLKQLTTTFDDAFLMFPRAKDIKKLLEFKVRPAIKGCKAYSEQLKDYTQSEKERANSYFYKTVRNIFAIISANDTKSITARWMAFDEAAEFEASVITEAMERAKTYGYAGFKALIASTQIHENDAINHFFNISEVKYQRRMECPSCKELFYPMPHNLSFPTLEMFKDEFGREPTDNEIHSEYKPWASKKGRLKCECGYEISDDERLHQIHHGGVEWVQVQPATVDDDGIVTGWEPAKNIKTEYKTVGFDINSMLDNGTPISTFVEKEIECAYAPLYERDTLYDKFYVGYWNIVYKPKSLNMVKKNDVLLLDNNLPSGVPHNDTAAIHIGVDLQKDRLYYEVVGFRYADDIVADIIEYGELYSNGIGDDFRDLEAILDATFVTDDGREIPWTSVGCDIRGFSLKEESSRSNEMLDFIFHYAKKLDDLGIQDQRIFPMLGRDKLPERYEIQGYMISKRKRTVDGEDIELPEIAFSNKKIKSILFSIIERSIAKEKENKTYDRMLLGITHRIVEDFEYRQSLPKKERRDKHSLEAHLTSEHLTYKLINGKPAKEQTYEKKYEGARNDWLDCTVMAIAQSLYLKTYNIEKYEETDDTEEVRGNILSVFR